MGWPQRTAELDYYYPTNTLITSRDIITLWVARMVLAGLNNMGEVPFREVYIHPKILDGYGETMSKSKGNGVDPLDVINKFGADALRFGLAYLTTDTQDVRMPVQYECPHCDSLIEQTKQNRELPRITCTKCRQDFSTQWAESDADKQLPRGPVVSERFELGRNFGNKLWNAARFAMMNLSDYTAGEISLSELATEDRWILSRLSTVTQQVTEDLEAYRFADATRTLYDFAWDEFCSFYVEMAKAQLNDADKRATAQRVLAHVLDSLLRLLHPMIPFITEEIWGLLGNVAPQRGFPRPSTAGPSVMVASWPQVWTEHQDATIERQFAQFQAVLAAIRKIRQNNDLAPKQEIEFALKCDRDTLALLLPMQDYFLAMAKARCTAAGPDVPAVQHCAQASLPGIEVLVDMAGLIDVEAEIARHQKEQDRLQRAIVGKEKQLSNASFVERAPADIVQRERDSLLQLKEQLQSVERAIVDLAGRR